MTEIDAKKLVLDAIQNKKPALLKELFETIPTIDIAEIMDDIDDVAQLMYVFRVVSAEYTGDLFAELSSEQQEKIIASFSDKELIKLLENSFADDIVDSMEDLPANLINRILKVAPKDLRKDINQLLNYKDGTAGALMTTEFIEMRDNVIVEDAIDTIREIGKDAETIYTIFVKDAKRTLVGTVDLDDLIFAKNEEKLVDIMNRDFVTCNVNDDQEEVANMFKRYDLNAMAVVNNENKIIGIITIDDVVDIIVEEATEDIAHLSQVSNMDEPYLDTPVFKLVLKCAPWIIALMILQVFSTLILSSFEGAIASFALLSVFTPLIMDAGGNAGGQTTTMIVRSISLDEFDRGDFKRVIWKELRVAACIATMIAVFVFGWLMLEMVIGIVDMESSMDTLARNGFNFSKGTVMVIVAGLVASTLFVTMVASRLVACMLPFIAKKLKLDPAVMCGPLTTTLVDVISLLTYFTLWTLLFGPILGF